MYNSKIKPITETKQKTRKQQGFKERQMLLSEVYNALVYGTRRYTIEHNELALLLNKDTQNTLREIISKRTKVNNR